MFPWYFLSFLKRSLVFSILLFSSISLHWSLRKAFLSLLAILWNSAFKWVCFLFFFAFCFPSFQRYLYGGGNEDNGDLPQKIPCMYCYTQCPQPCSRPASTQASSRDSWTHRQVWDSLSWGHCSFLLGHGVYKFLLCPPRVYFPVCCKFWQFYGGLIVTSSKRLLPFPSLWHPEPLSVWQTTANLYLHRRHSNTALSQSLWGL